MREYFIDNGVMSSLEFGVRFANHDRRSGNVVAQGPNWAASPFDPATFPQGYSNYPGRLRQRPWRHLPA